MGSQRRKTVESYRRISSGIRASPFDQHRIADLEADRQLVRPYLIKDVGTVAGRSGKDARPDLVPIPRCANGITDGFVQRLSEAAEPPDVQIDPARLVLSALLRNENHFGLDHASVADQTATGLDDSFRDAISEMLAQCAKDGTAVGLNRSNFAHVLGREAAAEIDHGKIDAAIRARAEDRGRRLQRLVPCLGT